ncbi:MAG: thioredoxin family protein [Oscillospiraceae bacterium]
MDTVTVTKENFDAEVLNSEVPVVVEFWMPMCGYCKRLAPVIDRLATKYKGKLVFAKMNSIEEDEIFSRYGGEVNPTLYLFNKGVPGEKLVAPSSQAEVEDWIKNQTAI